MTRQPFPKAQIPRSRMEPVALKLPDSIPLPDRPIHHRGTGQLALRRRQQPPGSLRQRGADACNAFDRARSGKPGNNLNAPVTFGRITSAGSGRSMQGALRLEC